MRDKRPKKYTPSNLYRQTQLPINYEPLDKLSYKYRERGKEEKF